MAIHDKDKRRDILTGNVVNPDENKEQKFNENESSNDNTSSENFNRVEGNTLSGAGGVAPGDASGDFDKPGTRGNPPVNDYVRRDFNENQNTVNRSEDSEDNQNPLEDEVKVPDNVKFTDPASGFPGKGAIKTGDDA